jgi:hypothetical protein
MGANAILAPFTWLLAILPGPNVVGYWFTYRAIHHALIVLGIRRVQGDRATIELCPREELDRPIERDENGRATHAALDGEAARLDEHVAWTEGQGPGTDAVGER